MLTTNSPFPGKTARQPIGETVVVETSEGTASYTKSGIGPCIVLLPSLGREGSDFNELAVTLNSAGYQTYTIDAGGIGKSSIGVAKDLYPAMYTVEIVSALDCGYREPLVVIGHAHGNRLARYHASLSKMQDGFDVGLIDTPTGTSDVKAVILLAAGGQVPIEPKAEQSLRDIFNPLKSHKARVKDVEYAFFAEGNDIPDHWTRGWYTKTAMAQIEAITKDADYYDGWHCAGGVPMLIVQPMQDRIAPIENAYALRDKCPQEVKIVEIQNAGHALLPEQPTAVAEAVMAFLAKHHPVEEALKTE